MIEREEIKFLAAADFTDDCRVVVEQRKRRTTYTVTEAEQLRAELDAAIGEASRAADDLLHRDVPPAKFDMLLGPDCKDEKHRACDGRALDKIADDVVACECPCHTEAVTA